MANQCRSPLAQGLLEKLLRQYDLVDQVNVDSAGVLGHYRGQKPDARAIEVARLSGFEIKRQRSRQVTLEDFERFDHIIAMDENNMRVLNMQASEAQQQKLRLMMSYAPELGMVDVPDPYYGPHNGFLRVVAMLEKACMGIIKDVIESSEKQV